MDFGVATDRGTDAVAYLNGSVNLTALLTSKPKSWQTSFTNDKGFKKFFFFPFPVINLALQKGSKNDFYPPLTCLRKKPRNVCFQLLLYAKDHQQFLCQLLDSECVKSLLIILLYEYHIMSEMD